MSAPVKFPRFFVTNPGPCPYLPGKTERKVFTELNRPHANELNDALGRIGFRRSQNVAYRPSCIDCKACISVRIVADEFAMGSGQKRIWKRNRDLVTHVCEARATEEQYALLRRYLSARHPDGGMSGMDESDFAEMIEETPVTSYMIEYREPGEDGRPGALVGACLTDEQSDGLSMVYSFFEPDLDRRSGLGTYMIMDHVKRAVSVRRPYVYLGYWVEQSPRMQYKVRFRPLERLGPEGWERFDTKALIAQIA